ncbi:MAG: DUF2867 domain-containing protein [Candidatus Eremiobacteraeota bacterium]|nr:DUF2867 domain-containing protein [Candidatus Eremiobacteraeota bacterium]
MRGVPLHDAWVVELPKPQAGITLDAFMRQTEGQPCTPPVVRALLKLRFAIGRVFGCDREPEVASAPFAARLTPDDRARTLAATGTRDG